MQTHKVILFTRLLLLIMGSLLTIDCLVLFALLKINFGTVVPFILGLIFLIHALFWHKIQTIIASSRLLKGVWQILWLLFFAWLVSFLLFVMILVTKINAKTELPSVDAVIVLGAGVNGDHPTPTLASRLDRASMIIKNQPNALPITSGGVGFGRQHSEAYVMAKYLQDKHGVPMKTIKQEESSTSTEENLLNSKPFLHSHHINPATASIAIVTNDFHTIRATAIAKKQGYGNAIAVASPTPLSIRFNAWFREYFAFVSGWILGEY